ncbi:MAG: hypothetical protein H0X29_08705 [Parachlamydiaceae bacterium]|nr:hypothetical protein [Parachlamydiaceae bacterium]
MRTEFRKEGRSLSEVFNNENCLKIFKGSGRLTLALAVYLEKLSPTTEKGNPHKIEAIRLANQFVEKPGLVTQLGLQQHRDNPVRLRKEIHNYLLENSGDKTANPDQKVLQAASALIDMFKHDTYKYYLAALQKERDEKGYVGDIYSTHDRAPQTQMKDPQEIDVNDLD